MSDLNRLEKVVLDAMLAGDDDQSRALREQASHATVLHRELTGVGFYTDLSVPDSIPRIKNHGSVWLGDEVVADIEGLELGAGFLLFVEDGRLCFLEGYTYGEPWPPDASVFTVRRVKPQGT